MDRNFIITLILAAVFSLTTGSEFELNILHNNDFHSRFSPTKNDSSPCDASSGNTTCIAGVARTVHMVEEIKSQGGNVIFLSAGDFFQGSLYYTEFKDEIINAFVPKMHYDAVCLGNHEFDDQAKGLYRYVNNMTARQIPVLAANLNLKKVPLLKNVKKSAVLTVDGHDIGIIGYVLPETRFLSTPDKEIEFLDEIPAIREEAQRLKKEGVKILIGLGHSGYAKDKEIAEQVEELDIIVGGHTNTFLWNDEAGPPPSTEKVLGSYPTVIEHSDGRKTLVVQAYAYGKYLGNLSVVFNDEGDVVRYAGNPILLDESVSQETEGNLTKKLEPYEAYLKKAFSKVKGHSSVFLEGNEHVCRTKECNMGNLVSDAFVYGFLNKTTREDGFKGWTKYPIAINCGGTIRTSFNPSGSGGYITLGDIVSVLPFPNTLVTVNVTGEILKQIMEHGVSAYDPKEERLEGRFPQVSGVRVEYDMSREVGDRVTRLRVKCSDCSYPVYEAVDNGKFYTIITTDYLASGGDGFDMLSKCEKMDFGEEPVDILQLYLMNVDTVTTGVEDRIVIHSNSGRRITFSFLSLILAFFASSFN